MDDPRKARLATIVKQVQKRVGSAPGLGMLHDLAPTVYEVVPTGFYDLDNMLLVTLDGKPLGGFPRTRLTMLSGPEQGGKSIIAYRTIAEVQRLGGIAALIDAEKSCQDAIGEEWLRRQGVNTAELIYSPYYLTETALDMIYDLARQKVDVIVLDSIPSLVPKGESLEKVEGQKKTPEGFGNSMPQNARLFSKCLPQILEAATIGRSVILFINQLREKVGLVYGSVESTPGGRALKHHASLHLVSRKTKDIIEDGRLVGNQAMVYVKKSKVSLPGRKTGEHTPGPLCIYYDGRKVTPIESLLTVAVDNDLIRRSGGSYTWVGVLDGQDLKAFGKESMKAAIADRGLEGELERAVRSLGLIADEDEDSDESDDSPE